MSAANVERGAFQGVTQIIRFNWPFYVVASTVCVAALVIAAWLPLPAWLRWTIDGGVTAALFWVVSSLVVSYWIYDWSPLCGWQWIADALQESPQRWLNIHCGFDESSRTLKAMFTNADGRVLDIFNEEMNESSILRARAFADRSVPSESADYRHLPAENKSQDAVFLLLAAHELRAPTSRAILFGEVSRVLRPGGRAVLAEHLRDSANFIAFGPGFLHFHSHRAWLKTIADSGMTLQRELKMTPFIAVFILEKRP